MGPNPAGAGDLDAQRQAIVKLFEALSVQLQFELMPKDPPLDGGGLDGLEFSGLGPLWGWEMDKGVYSTLPGLRDIDA